MTHLCENREDVFSRTCLTDIVWQPLPTWLLLLTLPFIALKLRSGSASIEQTPALPKWLIILDLVIIVAAFAMQALEVARLADASLGVGLLPFVFGGLVIAFMLTGSRLRIWIKRLAAEGRLLSCILLGFWFLSFVFEAVKVGEASTLAGHGPDDYPNSDRVSDTAVLLALYVVLFAIELFATFRDRQKRHNSNEQTNFKGEQ